MKTVVFLMIAFVMFLSISVCSYAAREDYMCKTCKILHVEDNGTKVEK
ncbi:hypothetical protein AGMMS49974_06470 [Deltaproteobacteria bacterium]|nr:hypothetical protein AGMMS49974_06470 [Deltaproteobacteria bacterium]GMO44995.1 MAG: hypothetical protein Ta2F_19230 [Termitinemataceae bacterium]